MGLKIKENLVPEGTHGGPVIQRRMSWVGGKISSRDASRIKACIEGNAGPIFLASPESSLGHYLANI